MAAIDVRTDGEPGLVHLAHLLPAGGAEGEESGGDDRKRPVRVLPPEDFHRLDLGFDGFVSALDEEIERRRVFDQGDKRERVLLLSVSRAPRAELDDSVEELRELAESANLLVVDTVIQRPKQLNPRFLMGEGKLRETIIHALNLGANILVFDQNLNPSQQKAITDLTELKVIDRTQLILDIFAHRATSREGKAQVELAQLKYRLPRLAGKGTAMSRLMGGIGGRGPGEKKLEVDRRRVRERINRLEKELENLSAARAQRKSRRASRDIPIVSIVGYTNAGKSTLLNALTSSETFVEKRMFATLDTASRRLRFPKEREVIITDTVGFIRDLPEDLITAFKSTLEELQDADLLLHLVDISNPRYERQMASVEKILGELDLGEKPEIIVLNKVDLLEDEIVRREAARLGAIPVSALDPSTFAPLLEAIERKLF